MKEFGNVMNNGIRIWREDLKKMYYLDNRYTICIPAYYTPFASVLVNGKSKVRNETFMLRIEEPNYKNNKGVFEKDIVSFKYKGKTEKGVIEYYDIKKMWVVRNDNHIIPYCNISNITVIGNIFEN